VNVPGPQGDPGVDGENGLNGGNAYTITTANFTVPAVGNDVTVEVASSDWMVITQKVVVQGPASFTVAALPDSQHATLTFEGFTGDVAPATNILAGASVGPSGTEPAAPSLSTVAPVTAYASGTAYPLTTTPALLDFGTTDPSITLTTAGTWLLTARVRIDYNAATFAANRTVSLKLRRTNNTASDITATPNAFKTEIITTLSHTAMVVEFPAVAYTTSNITDIIQMFGSVDTLPSAGTIDAVEASITAVYLFA
jgi:hypothetical protein